MKCDDLTPVCDDRVTTYFRGVVTAESRVVLTFEPHCDDRDDLLLLNMRAHTRADTHARARITYSRCHNVTNNWFTSLINNLGCDDLAKTGRHRSSQVVT